MKKIVLSYLMTLCFSALYAQYYKPDLIRKVNVTIPSPNVSVAADIGIYYKSCGISTSKGKITKPFIMVEGYDLGKSMSFEDYYKKVDKITGNVYTGLYYYLFENLRADGWDVILIDLNYNNTLIQSNAELLKKSNS